MELKNFNEIETLLNKYLEGKCNEDEKQQINKLFADEEYADIIKTILYSQLNLYNNFSQSDNEIEFNHLYNKIITKIQDKQELKSEPKSFTRKFTRQKFLIRSSAVAALIIFAFILGNVFSFHDKKGTVPIVSSTKYYEVKAPLGSKSEIVLSDGTYVTLNAGSLIRYSGDFNYSNRKIYLEGEAYFKIAKNEKLPLFVDAGNISIKAVGTEFNVKAYKDEATIETTLIEGKIEIIKLEGDKKNMMSDLKPNQKAIYLKESDKLMIGKIKENESLAVSTIKTHIDRLLISPQVDVEQAVAWTQNKLIIKSENLEKLCVTLQRKYNVNFVFGNDEVKKFRFTGILQDETLQQVLDVIKLTAPINYFIEGKQVLMYSNEDRLKNYSNYLKK
jgi:ferric-dicitrate binding protein FerR (iron transport regulator)